MGLKVIFDQIERTATSPSLGMHWGFDNFFVSGEEGI